MNEISFENYLGIKIDNININNLKPIKNTTLKNTFSISLKSLFKYYNNYISHIYFITNENKQVNQILVNLTSLIDKQFYNQLVFIYGEPDIISIKDGISHQSQKSVNPKNTLNQSVQKTIYNIRVGSFEEKPVHLLWKKESFQIEVFMKYDRNNSQIIFRKPKNL